MFLLPVKTLRQTSGNLPGSHLDTTSNEDSFRFQSESEEGDENSSQGDTQVQTTEIPKKIVSSMQQPVRKRKAVPNMEHDDTNTTILEMMKQRQAQKLQESPRLNLFRSLMPSVDNLDEEQFLNFQMDVIQALQRQKRVPRLAGTYQQQQSPCPSSNFSEVSRDSYPGPGYNTYRPLPLPSNQQESYPERATTSYNTYDYLQ